VSSCGSSSGCGVSRAVLQRPGVAQFRQDSWPRRSARNTVGRRRNPPTADWKPDPIPLPNIPLPDLGSLPGLPWSWQGNGRGKPSRKSPARMNSTAKAKSFRRAFIFLPPYFCHRFLKRLSGCWQKHGGRKIRTHFKGMRPTSESVVAGQSASLVPLWLRRQPRWV
jgi:hypothetical protein